MSPTSPPAQPSVTTPSMILDDAMEDDVTLSELADPPPGERPGYEYRVLVAAAIRGSPRGKLLLQEIYNALRRRFPYYANLKKRSWKDSIRHMLSLQNEFQKLPRPRRKPGRGNYWTAHRIEGTKRPRVRGPSKAKAPQANTQPGSTTTLAEQHAISFSASPLPASADPLPQENSAFPQGGSHILQSNLLTGEQVFRWIYYYHDTRTDSLIQCEEASQSYPLATSGENATLYNRAYCSMSTIGTEPAPVPYQPRVQTTPFGHINVARTRDFTPAIPSPCTSTAEFDPVPHSNAGASSTLRPRSPQDVPLGEGKNLRLGPIRILEDLCHQD